MHNRLPLFFMTKKYKYTKKPGRPPKYKSAKLLHYVITRYFRRGKYDPDFRPTICGLVLYCGFCDRNSFYDLEKQEEFSGTVKKARLAIQAVYERNLHRNNAAGSIFALKNFGWRDDTPTLNLNLHMTQEEIDARNHRLKKLLAIDA